MVAPRLSVPCFLGKLRLVILRLAIGRHEAHAAIAPLSCTILRAAASMLPWIARAPSPLLSGREAASFLLSRRHFPESESAPLLLVRVVSNWVYHHARREAPRSYYVRFLTCLHTTTLQGVLLCQRLTYLPPEAARGSGSFPVRAALLGLVSAG